MIDENYANILGRRLFALGRHEQIAGKARLIVDLDQEIGQFHATHPLCQSGFEVSQTVFLLVQFLGGLGSQPGELFAVEAERLSAFRLVAELEKQAHSQDRRSISPWFMTMTAPHAGTRSVRP
jgi:hypothetical protein